MIIYGFHPDALLEYAEATNYYLREASADTAEAFVTAVESAIARILEDPQRWRVIDKPSIRRYVFRRPFPYVIYYRLESDEQRVTIYSVLHTSREPELWKGRIS